MLAAKNGEELGAFQMKDDEFVWKTKQNKKYLKKNKSKDGNWS